MTNRTKPSGSNLSNRLLKINTDDIMIVSIFFILFFPLTFSQNCPPLACIFFFHQLVSPNKKRYKLSHYTTRREKMLREKIDYAKFLTWFIEHYPKSAKETKEKQEDTSFWAQFK
jgi:hypothetical protein